jgi:hydroxyacylglutathione hydrolase
MVFQLECYLKKYLLFFMFIVLFLQSYTKENIKSTYIDSENNHTMSIHVIDLGGINSYLIKTNNEFFMIDNGISSQRTKLDKILIDAGCMPGNLKLIILTHGDIDHVNNSVYLREKYSAKIAINIDDSGIVETGNMGFNRKAKPDKNAFIFQIITFFGKKERFETFKPDIYLENEQNLSEYGLNAQVFDLKGHSKGSIGILTADGDFFCGDLLINFGKPDFHFMISDMTEAKMSVERIKKLPIKIFYPGHGKSFTMDDFLKRKL